MLWSRPLLHKLDFLQPTGLYSCAYHRTCQFSMQDLTYRLGVNGLNGASAFRHNGGAILQENLEPRLLQEEKVSHCLCNRPFGSVDSHAMNSATNRFAPSWEIGRASCRERG